ncbi:MAG: 50S ribosomal protein L25 [Limnochordia bacterium]|jgi:large subunit ribosomal protein L25
MADVQLTAEPRAEIGKGVARKLRAVGKIPGVIYGSKEPSQGIIVDTRECSRLLNEGALGRLVKLNLAGKEKMVLFKDAQVDPVKGDLLHVDFHAVAMDEEISTIVSIRITGEEDRVSDGGVLASNLWELEVSCLPTNIPDEIAIDVSGLAVGENITVADIEAPEGVTILTSPEEVVVSVVAPVAEEEAEEGAEVAEDDVVEEAAEEAADEE